MQTTFRGRLRRTVPWVALLLLAACGDDFARAETAAADTADPADTQATADTADGAGAGDIGQDDSSDSGADDAADDAAADTTTDTTAPLPGACTVDDDCADEAGPCQVATCTLAGCLVSAAVDGTACDDGEACTIGDTCKAGACAAGSNGCGCAKSSDCADLDDGDACNGTYHCKIAADGQGACEIHPATIPQCQGDGDPCTVEACEAKTGSCTSTPAVAGVPCDDGVACTSQDACAGGKCVGGPSVCDCQTSADCAAKDDANLCNGKLFCDTTGWPFKCRTNPLSVVSCKDTTPAGDCTAVACVPATGLCEAVTLTDGSACDDGQSCTKGDSCKAGACVGPTNVCPCSSAKDCDALDDGDACNGTLYCETKPGLAGCRVNPATVVTCPAESLGPCLVSTCQPADGSCKPTPTATGTPCEDGELCTTGDTCASGTCTAGPNGCACTKLSDCAPFEDGDACNGTLFCDTAKLPFACRINPKSIVSCPDDGAPCTAPACDPADGSCSTVALPDGVTCDADGFACTAVDACKAGTCLAGSNVCTCAGDADCGPHEDGNLCNGTLFCDKSAVPFVCKVNPTTEVVCQAPKPGGCALVACDAQTGACVTSNAPDGASCNADSDACTAGDACKAGVCVPGPNTCGCAADVDCAALDDGDSCNGSLFCDKSALPFACKIKPGSATVCDPAKDTGCVQNLCAKSVCSMTTLADGSACDDGAPCTVGDACASGSCAPGPNLCGCVKDSDCVVFDDGNLCNGIWFCDVKQGSLCAPAPQSAVTCSGQAPACTELVCKPETGSCEAVPLALDVSKSCDDGSLCTTGDTCVGGSCKGQGAKDCNDGNSCTVDACQATTGCKSAPAQDGSVCSDGDSCSVDDACGSGVCVGGKPKVCPDGKACEVWSCKGGLCQLAQGQSGCSDGNPCTLDICEGADGCSHTPDGKASTCGSASSCVSGSCGTCATWSRLYQSGQTLASDVFVGVAVSGGGVWTAVGSRLEGPKSIGTWATQLDATGKAAATQTDGSTLASLQPEAVASADGGVVHAGHRTTGIVQRAYMRMVDDALQTKWQWVDSGPSETSAFHAVARRSAGAFWLGVGSSVASGASAGLLVEIDDKGNPKSSASIFFSNGQLVLRGVASVGGQDWVIAGQRDLGDGYLVRINKMTKLNGGLDFVWATAASALKGRPLEAVVALGTDQFAAAGAELPSDPDGLPAPFVVAVSAATGATSWTWKGDAAYGGGLLGAAVVGSRLVAVGSRGQALGPGSSGLLVGLSGAGKLDWLTPIGAGVGASVLRSVVPVAGGGLAVGSLDGFSGDARGWAVHFSEAGKIFCGP